MNEPVRRPDTLPVVGTRRQWAFDATLIGAVAGGTSTVLLTQMFAMGLHAFIISTVLASAGAAGR